MTVPSLYASITLTEAQAFQALGSFLQAVLPPTCQVTRGALNRVPEPLVGDFVTMMQIGQRRLAWNETTFVDNIITASAAPGGATFTGAIAGFTLTVSTAPSSPIVLGAALSGAGVAAGTIVVSQISGSAGAAGTYQLSASQSVASEPMSASWGVLTATAFVQNEGPLVAGALLTDQTTHLLAGTVILQQLTGPVGGLGTYAVAGSQTVASETMYAGQRIDLVQTQLDVQVDVHGLNSGNNAKIIEGLFFSEAAYDQFLTSGFDVHPLYCDEPRQTPFVNDQQQVEWRYSVDAHLQINPAINSWQQFADQIVVTIKPPVNMT